MKHKIHDFLAFLLLGTKHRSDFKKTGIYIYNYNHANLKLFSAFFFIILAVQKLLTFIFPAYSSNSPFLIPSMILTLGLYLSTKLIFKKDQYTPLVLIFYYILFTATLVFGIFIGTASDKSIAVTFNVMIVVMPICMCDRPYRINILLILMSILFLFISHSTKTEYYYTYDATNCLSFLIIGLCINTKLQIAKMTDFRNRYIIKKQNSTDTLSGTLTRDAFEEYAQKTLKKKNAVGALMILDVDNFKSINDTFGHSIGDYFISNTGHCILKCFRTTDAVGRFGGDEFVAYINGAVSQDGIFAKANEIRQTLKDFFASNMHYKKYSISIGCVIFKNTKRSYQQLFDKADHALYVAKDSGKDKCIIFDEQEEIKG